jgi:hypothetical protein
MLRKTLFSIAGALAVSVSAAQEPGPNNGSGVIETPKMRLEFDSGWLVKWENRETGETVDFGRPALSDEKEDAPYRPGPWWVDWKSPANPAAAKSEMKISRESPVSASVRQKAETAEGEIHALQWGIQIPYDKIQAVHWPRGLAPARLSGTGYHEGMVKKDYQFNGRAAMLAGADKIRHQYYAVQAKTGGLLIYMENPELEHNMALEFKKPDDKTLVISNRSIMPPPWKSTYAGARWIIRQYTGGVNNAAQIYQDYITKAYDLTPLDKRPTRWARDITFVQVNDFLRGPLPAPGFRQPNQNYLSGEAWRKSMEFHSKWLEDMAKILDPSKTMFYITDWRQDGMDMMFPNTDIDPYFALMIGKARKLGFHVMLHCHNHLIHGQTTFWRRYIEHPATLKGQDPVKDLIEGVGLDALRNSAMSQKNKISGSVWDERKGLNRVMDWHTMNPAHEGVRYLMVGNLLSAVRASGADAIHLDVPSIWVDLRGEMYGMNQMRGQREFYKLLRKTLDENGFDYVAIATELTPFEGFMKYVDFSQNSRDSSAKGRVESIERGGDIAGEELLALQSGKDWEDIIKERQAAEVKNQKSKPSKPSPETFKAVFKQARDLSEPSLDNMVIAPFIQSYPHLGAYPGSSPVAQHLAQWYSLTHDVMPHTAGSFDFTKPIPPFEAGKIALSRFGAREGLHLMRPADWEEGDIARYQLKDGRILRVTRADETTLRLAFSNGDILTELDLLQGWKNDKLLMENYSAPQISETK